MADNYCGLCCEDLQCSIDLKRNVLVLGTTGTITPFLPESQIPNWSDSDED